MASAQVSAEMPKPSFAKVAASASKENAPLAAVRQAASPARVRTGQSSFPPVDAPPVIANGGVARAPPRAAPQPKLPQKAEPAESAKIETDEKLVGGVNNLSLGPKTPSLVVNGSGSTFAERSKSASRDTGSDESQKADSSSELGTKPPSLDGKSITSGTTFALDEKESLRPDDSASVKAAAEDDDAFSIRGSRMGSELAARARGIHLGDIAERRPYPAPGPHIHGAITPQSGSSEPPPMAGTSMPLGNVPPPNALTAIYGQGPDEKLLEAMQSPKDRLFLLRLEKDVIEFVQDSKEPYMDLPPSNSFCRMLTHKLADYYRMTHSYEHAIGAVRIFRTPFCRVPLSLASMEINPSAASTPPPAMLPKKIMRRGEDGESVPVSASPSKPTSEAGSDGKDKPATAKEKMTREEREEAYNRARERIFGTDKTGESTPENDGENGVSRASSISAKGQPNLGKKGKTNRQRRGSDSFESRHHYAPYWGPQQQAWGPQPQYVPVGNPGGFVPQGQPPFPAQVGGPGFVPQPQAQPQPFPQPMIQNMPYNGPGYANVPPYQQPPNQQRYPGPPNPAINNFAHGPPPQPGPQPGWQPPPPPHFSQGPPPYPARSHPGPPSHPSHASHSGPTVGIPYAYGQLPVNANPHDPKSQHPIPGSYNRHAFNPNTKSFVPGGGMSPIQPPQPPFTAPGSHQSSPYSGYQQPVLPQQFTGNAGYGMARQGSNNAAMPPYHATQPHHPQHPQHPPLPMPQMPQQMVPPMPQPMPQQHHMAHGPPPPPPPPPPQQQVPHLPPSGAPHHMGQKPIPQGPAAMTGGAQYSNHLPNYGNPATLPQKPTTTGI